MPCNSAITPSLSDSGKEARRWPPISRIKDNPLPSSNARTKCTGGTCINIACIPTKTLVYEAHKSLCRGERSFEEKAADYRRAIARKNEVTRFPAR